MYYSNNRSANGLRTAVMEIKWTDLYCNPFTPHVYLADNGLQAIIPRA